MALHQNYGIGTASVGLVVVVDEDGNVYYYDYNKGSVQSMGKLQGEVVAPVNVACDSQPHNERGETFVAIDGVGTIWVGNTRGLGPNPVPVNGSLPKAAERYRKRRKPKGS